MIDFACKTFELEEVIKCALGLTRADFRILKWLIECRCWQTSEDLAEETGFNLSTVQRSVKRMSEKNILFRQQNNRDEGGYLFVYRVKSKDHIKSMIIDNVDEWRDRLQEELEEW